MSESPHRRQLPWWLTWILSNLRYVWNNLYCIKATETHGKLLLQYWNNPTLTNTKKKKKWERKKKLPKVIYCWKKPKVLKYWLINEAVARGNWYQRLGRFTKGVCLWSPWRQIIYPQGEDVRKQTLGMLCGCYWLCCQSTERHTHTERGGEAGEQESIEIKLMSEVPQREYWVWLLSHRNV